MNQDPGWAKGVALGVGKRVAHYRGKMSAQQLADRCKELGMPALSRIVITRLENGRRDAVSVAEVSVLAKALGVSPLELLFPLGQAETAEVLPGRHIPPFDAMQWFADQVELAEGSDGQLRAVPPSRDKHPRAMDDYHLFQAHQQAVDWLIRDLRRAAEGSLTPPGAEPPHDEATILEGHARLVQHYRAFIRERDLTPPVLPAEAAAHVEAARQPVAAAIVTSDLGVLVGRRNDGKPPWTFIAGEVEPGEFAEHAAVREVKEETGLRIQAGKFIGQRVHPKTGRIMIYLAATPTHGTDAFVGDSTELAEVRWVSLAEAGELLPDMFGPVREYLAETLGGGSDGPR